MSTHAPSGPWERWEPLWRLLGIPGNAGMAAGHADGAFGGGADRRLSRLLAACRRQFRGRPTEEQRLLVETAGPYRTRRQLERLAASPRDEGEAFRFAVMGDAEPGRFWLFRSLFNRPGAFEAQLGAIESQPVDFSIQLGDMVSRGVVRNYLRFFRTLRGVGLRIPYLTVIGNHDRHSPHRRTNADLYRACFGFKTNYYFDRGCARFVVLDTSARALSRRQLKWLDLVLGTDLRKLVFTHVPPATFGWTDFAGRRGVGGFRSGAEEFTSLMSRKGVERVYFGHIHGFGVQDRGGVRYVLTGGGGSPLFPSGVEDRFHHYIVAEVSRAGVKETVHGLDGGRFEIPRGRVLVPH